MPTKRARFTASLSLAALALAAGCDFYSGPSPTCHIGYDDKWQYARGCEGTVITTYGAACDERTVQHGTDCAAVGAICVSLSVDNPQCVTPCTRDDECPAVECCTPISTGSSSGYCGNRVREGGDCTLRPTHCESGFVCVPKGPATDTPTKVCKPDCTKVDPASQTCPAGASSTCAGGNIVACRCGVPQSSEPVERCAPRGLCLIADETGLPVCTLAQAPDPRCAGGSFCEGNTRVSCEGGYVVERKDCGLGRTCASVEDCSARVVCATTAICE